MPLEADGGVVLGPLPADGYDWYLISYTMVDEGRFDGGKGWGADGPAETPWLAPASPGGVVGGTTSFRGTAGTGPGVVGPVEIGDYYGLSWAAVGEDCPLVVSINDVAVVSTRVDGFAEADVSLGEYPELLGTFDIEVETECSWTLSHGTYQG